MSGFLINAQVVPVEGVDVVNVHDDPDCRLTLGKDYRARARAPHQIILHKTIADDPEKILPGAGPAGGAAKTAAYWRSSDGKTNPYRNAGAHLVTGDDGVVWCLADLATDEVFHATVSNAYSVGIETRELPGGGVYQAALDATVLVTLAACRALGVQLQIPRGAYSGHPLRRMLDGGTTMIGVFGHRSNTEARGRWDPGDILFGMLRAHGAEVYDFDAGDDIVAWKGRQLSLNEQGFNLVVDGIPGAATTAALKSQGYIDGIFALGRLG